MVFDFIVYYSICLNLFFYFAGLEEMEVFSEYEKLRNERVASNHKRML